jgi:hypothetical protein
VNFKHDPTSALLAPVTEFGFFSLPDSLATEPIVFDKIIGPGDDMKTHPVITVGKAKGAATGFVFAVKPEMAAEGQTTAFTGVFGVCSDSSLTVFPFAAEYVADLNFDASMRVWKTIGSGERRLNMRR